MSSHICCRFTLLSIALSENRFWTTSKSDDSSFWTLFAAGTGSMQGSRRKYRRYPRAGRLAAGWASACLKIRNATLFFKASERLNSRLPGSFQTGPMTSLPTIISFVRFRSWQDAETYAYHRTLQAESAAALMQDSRKWHIVTVQSTLWRGPRTAALGF